MGHTAFKVFPTAMVTPMRNGSVFNPFILAKRVLVSLLLSMAMSAMHRCHVGSCAAVEGQHISPDRKNPKKHKFMAAQIMMLS